MPKSPKRASRQARREARTQTRQTRREERRPSARPTQFHADETPKPSQKAVSGPFVPLTEAQAIYGEEIEEARITFGIGPAGTGKTYYATRMACRALDRGEITKIYLTRPAVEAGESLGFLPGELEEKYEPYLRPFKDALYDHFGQSHTEYLIRVGTIEPVPLGFLRGATVKSAWMIADEMQNATKSQMKMLLTRIGKDAKFVVNGDPKQCDLPNLSSSGLADAVERMSGVEGIASVTFTRADVVRDDIVQSILEAYDE